MSLAITTCLGPKAKRPTALAESYPYILPRKLTDGVYGADDPNDDAWVEFATANKRPSFFGVDGFTMNNASIGEYAADMGVQVVRVNCNWRNTEDPDGVYDWDVIDLAIDRCLDNGMKPYFLVWATPSWAITGGGSGITPPTNLQDFADFCVALVQHVNSSYSGLTSKAIEVWNEINEGAFWTGTIATYLEMLRLAYNSVKAEDATWQIIGETFSGLQLDRINRAYVDHLDGSGNSILKDYCDMVAIHPYLSGVYSPDDPANAANVAWTKCGKLLADNQLRLDATALPNSAFSWSGFAVIDEDDVNPITLRNFRQVMIANGDTKPVWITEIGWHRTAYDGSNANWTYAADAMRVAEMVTRMIEKASEYDFVENVTIFSLFSNNTADLVQVPGFTLTNAYYAYQNLATNDGIVIDLSESPFDLYPSPAYLITNVVVGSLNWASAGVRVNRITSIAVSISLDNVTYTSVGTITNNGPESGRVNLELDNINQRARWIKLAITAETTAYLIDEILVNGRMPAPSNAGRGQYGGRSSRAGRASTITKATISQIVRAS